MLRLIVLLLLTSSLLVVFGISNDAGRTYLVNSSQAPSQTATPEKPACTKCRRPTEDGSEVLNESPNVTDLTLDKTELRLPCRAGDEPPPTPSTLRDAMVAVKTTAEDPENDVLTYAYTVSAGRVVGNGANVIWNLAGVDPGTFVITAGVDDGCGFCGKTMSKVVSVECS